MIEAGNPRRDPDLEQLGQALRIDQPQATARTRQAVLARIGGRSPTQIEDQRRAVGLARTSAGAAALLVSLLGMLAIVNEHPKPQPAEEAPLPAVIALEEDGFETETALVFADVLIGEYGE